MPTLTTREFDQILAAFSFVLEQAIENPPAFFDVEDLIELREAVEDLRLSALENEAENRITTPDLDSAFQDWLNLTGRYRASDK